MVKATHWANKPLWQRFWPLAVLAAIWLVFYLLPVDFFAHLPIELCLIKRFFHHECFGCGTLRALSFLAHGQLSAAWASNQLVFAYLAALTLYQTQIMV